jgi:glutathione S-transferase
VPLSPAAIRVALHDAGLAYEEVYPENWLAYKAAGVADGSLPFGQNPQLLLDDGTSIVQSNAILRHVGRTGGLYGKTESDMCHVGA